MAIEARYKMSRERFDEIQAELHTLETVRAKEVSELIKEARSFGDLSENSEYDEAKTEQGKLYSKIAELKNIIENVEIIEEVEHKNVVGLGCFVEVKCVGEKEVEKYQIVGSQEANPMQGRISDDSPFGKGLMGHKEGDTVAVEAPAGEIKYKIMKIENKNGEKK